ncbi:M14 family metallopeptidase [Tenacibaculum geojense]|uniref:M14 family metallopeptidase n=1 Tax=Tenacibaculum geojense TaxID=915352 RepID=A0ABW3JU78_9FLAO
MKKLTLIPLLFLVISCLKSEKKKNIDFTTLFEKSNGTETPTYPEVIDYYKNLAENYNEISLIEMGETDSSYPLHLIVFNADGKTNKKEIKTSKKNRILINNGIHPGESDGIDASMLLLRDITQNDSLKKAYKNTLICVIPVYNIGGALNRNSHTRANQNGPKEYGFRGNARNYDLNRDFTKQDTKNAASFAEIFHVVNPDVFIDNHVSNGADYQYAITHLFTQHNKLGGELGAFLEGKMRPSIENSLSNKNIPITPYVNVWGTTPDKGWSQFYDSPRYSTGYTTLFNTLGLMVETHMLKPYKTRVEQTYELMIAALDFTEQQSNTIKKLRANAVKNILTNKKYPIAFKVDKNNPSSFTFKGYEGTYIDSKVTNGKRLFYDTKKPFEKEINYYNNFTVTREVNIPKAYIIPQGWHEVINRLKNNAIEIKTLHKDTIIEVETYKIDSYDTRKVAYEGHYLHYNTKVVKETQKLGFKKGDYFIPTNQNGLRYLLEILEPEAIDSFFNWNFFDTVLQQKEGFSAYVFEDKAETFLKENPEIEKVFKEKLISDEDFKNNPYSQLKWVYEQTPHYENAHLKIPVYRVN